VYIPTHFAADDAALVRLLAHPSAADLVTATADGLLATPLPLLFERTPGRTARCSVTWPATTTSGVAHRSARRW
jgi:predicted FMN-binding regulatory protein PaiB